MSLMTKFHPFKNVQMSRCIVFVILLNFALAAPALCGQAPARIPSDAGWPTYSADPGGTRYSPANK